MKKLKFVSLNTCTYKENRFYSAAPLNQTNSSAKLNADFFLKKYTECGTN